MLETLGDNYFMRHDAQFFQEPVLIKAYMAEDNQFIKSALPKKSKNRT